MKLGLRYGALRRRELTLEDGDVYSTFEVRQGSGLAPGSERLERVSAFRQPTLNTWTNPEDGKVKKDKKKQKRSKTDKETEKTRLE
ncbi:hypothetical protein Tco_1486647 [Tanacetum coccineum]